MSQTTIITHFIPSYLQKNSIITNFSSNIQNSNKRKVEQVEPVQKSMFIY